MGNKLTAILDQLAGTGPLPTRPPAIDNAYEPIGDPMPDKLDGFVQPDEDAILGDLGGYPAEVPYGSPFTGDPTAGTVAATAGRPAPCGCKDKAPTKVRRFSSVRYTFVVTDSTPVLVTPSGVDSNDILRAVLTVSAANAVRVGSESNNAQAGAFLTTVQPLELTSGPIYIVPQLLASTVDVVVEYLA